MSRHTHHFGIIAPNPLLKLRRQSLYFFDKDLNQLIVDFIGRNHILIQLIRKVGNEFFDPVYISR